MDLRNQNAPLVHIIFIGCTESYYLLSVANKIFTHPSNVFTLKKQITKMENNNILEKFKINRLSVFSHKNLLGMIYIMHRQIH